MIEGKFCDDCHHKSEDLQYKCCFQVKKNEEIQVCFVETADRDYIVSRALLKLGLIEEALFHISQALEKYLKSILLYENCTVRNISHKIGQLRDKVKEKLGIDPDLDIQVWNQKYSFYDTIEFNNDRYGIIAAPELNFLSFLDEAVFKIRKYCRDIDLEATICKESREEYIRTICPLNPKIGAYLERVLESSKESSQEILLQKEILCWKNKYAPMNVLNIFTTRNMNIKRQLFDEGPLCQKSLETWRKDNYKVTPAQEQYLKLFGRIP